MDPPCRRPCQGLSRNVSACGQKVRKKRELAKGMFLTSSRRRKVVHQIVFYLLFTTSTRSLSWLPSSRNRISLMRRSGTANRSPPTAWPTSARRRNSSSSRARAGPGGHSKEPGPASPYCPATPRPSVGRRLRRIHDRPTGARGAPARDGGWVHVACGGLRAGRVPCACR